MCFFMYVCMLKVLSGFAQPVAHSNLIEKTSLLIN